jgi:hypothetical protein
MTAVVLLTLGFLGPNLAFAHTATYNAGFSRDKQSSSLEPPVDMCQSADFRGIDLQHCVQGYEDATSSGSSSTPHSSTQPGPIHASAA